MKYILLTLLVDAEGDYFVSKCAELGTSSFGRTKEEAIKNLADATELYLTTLEDLKECAQVLRGKGIPVRELDSPAARQVPAVPPTSTSAVYFQVMPLQCSYA